MDDNDPDTRFEAALRLAEDDPARGAEALRSIVADDKFDRDTRFEAAHDSPKSTRPRPARPCAASSPSDQV